MRRSHDPFEDPESRSAVASIMQALDVRRGLHYIQHRVPSGIVLLAVFALFIGVIWVAYPKGDKPQDPEIMPLVRADTQPYKFAPEDPGGMDIPYRDSTVFNAMRGDVPSATEEEPVRRVENLLEISEPTPQSAPDSVSEDIQDITESVATTPPKPDSVAQIAKNEVKEEEKITEVKSEIKKETHPEKTASASTPVPSSKPAMSAAAKRAAQTAPAAGTPKASSKTAEKHYFIQLGSLPSRTDAEKARTRLKNRFPSALGHLSLQIKEANLGTRGTWYRVRSGPLTASQALSACDVVKMKDPGGCLVVTGE